MNRSLIITIEVVLSVIAIGLIIWKVNGIIN